MKFLDRIPRIAYQVGMDESYTDKQGIFHKRIYWGYVVFGIKWLKQNLELEREYADDDIFVWRPVIISPAKLEKMGEFMGW